VEEEEDAFAYRVSKLTMFQRIKQGLVPKMIEDGARKIYKDTDNFFVTVLTHKQSK
jgi:hypothetical protein